MLDVGDKLSREAGMEDEDNLLVGSALKMLVRRPAENVPLWECM